MTKEKEIIKEETIEKPKNKIADRPHRISIILSIVAVVISCLSWWESHNSRLISQSTNRAIVYPRVFRDEHADFKSPGPKYQLVIKNFGKSNASNVHYSYEFIVSPLYVPDYKNQRKKGEIPGGMNTWEELPPGLEKAVNISVDWKRDKLEIPIPDQHESLFLVGYIMYTDETTGGEYRQDFCFGLGNENSKGAEVSLCSGM